MVLKEREFRKCKFRDNKRRLLNEFKASRHEFDKNLKNAKRKHNQEVMHNIDQACNSIRIIFVMRSKKLGPRKNNLILMEACNNLEEITECILNIWKNDFF